LLCTPRYTIEKSFGSFQHRLSNEQEMDRKLGFRSLRNDPDELAAETVLGGRLGFVQHTRKVSHRSDQWFWVNDRRKFGNVVNDELSTKIATPNSTSNISTMANDPNLKFGGYIHI
ncbi:hypothetical protein SJ920_14640, partial [Enterococcus faecium]